MIPHADRTSHFSDAFDFDQQLWEGELLDLYDGAGDDR
jgi:hypothetical protein